MRRTRNPSAALLRTIGPGVPGTCFARRLALRVLVSGRLRRLESRARDPRCRLEKILPALSRVLVSLPDSPRLRLHRLGGRGGRQGRAPDVERGFGLRADEVEHLAVDFGEAARHSGRVPRHGLAQGLTGLLDLGVGRPGCLGAYSRHGCKGSGGGGLRLGGRPATRRGVAVRKRGSGRLGLRRRFRRDIRRWLRSWERLFLCFGLLRRRRRGGPGRCFRRGGLRLCRRGLCRLRLGEGCWRWFTLDRRWGAWGSLGLGGAGAGRTLTGGRRCRLGDRNGFLSRLGWGG